MIKDSKFVIGIWKERMNACKCKCKWVSLIFQDKNKKREGCVTC